MKAYVKHRGYSPKLDLHYYIVILENGHVDLIYESTYTSVTELEMDDKLWGEGSGWIDYVCDVCGYTSRERVYEGAVITCPVCGTEETVPDGVILEGSNLC